MVHTQDKIANHIVAHLKVFFKRFMAKVIIAGVKAFKLYVSQHLQSIGICGSPVLYYFTGITVQLTGTLNI